jgi:hypothetical protein
MLFFLISCSDYTLKHQKTDPDIEITYEDNFFGRASVIRSEETQRTFKIKNKGGSSLEIDSIYLLDGNDFDILNYEEGIILEQFESFNLDIEFSPSVFGAQENYFSVTSNDPDDQDVRTKVYGWGTSPKIIVNPDQYVFSETFIGCENDMVVQIKNEGDDSLEVYDAIMSGDSQFEVNIISAINGEFPWVISPGESRGLYVSFSPDSYTSNISYLNVISNDPSNFFYEIRQFSSGTIFDSTTDNFTVQSESKLDLIFVVDNSGSMNDNQQTLQSNARIILEHMDDNYIDYQIGVMTTDEPWLVGPVISYLDPNKISELQSQLLVGTSGSATERGMEMLYQLFFQNNISQNFIRESANLGIIFVTDENDSSSAPVMQYFNYYSTLKASQSALKLHAVSGIPGISACAQDSVKLDYLTSLSGGIFADICQLDWGYDLTNIINISSQPIEKFYLTKEAIPQTIKVYVNGVDVGNSFTYNLSDNYVEISGTAAVFEGDSVSIEYGLYGCR